MVVVRPSNNIIGKHLEDSLSASTINQVHLEKVIKDIFPKEEVVPNARKESNVLNPKTGKYFELDLWLPTKNLAFEFQDDYHYVTTWYSHLSRDIIRDRDDLKRDTVYQQGITLIEIPCWWDSNKSSLVASICFERPDLGYIAKKNYRTHPISLNPPREYFEVGSVPDVGELMYASTPVYLSSFTETISPENAWWMGEKYDGIRSCWNADRQVLYSRSGYEQPFLSEFIDLCPDIYLDCETWFGRGFFPETQRLVKGFDVDWPFLRLVTFDNPERSMHSLSFEDRYSSLIENVPKEHPFILIAQRVWCETQKHMAKTLEFVINDGGEGVILRKPTSVYENGRSEALWKLKATRGDMEALVVTVEDDSVLLQLPNGVTFPVPTLPDLPLNRGEVVTFTYENFTNKSVPVNPQLNRKREDVTWGHVVREFFQQQAKEQAPVQSQPHFPALQNGDTIKTPNKFVAKPTNYWKNEKNMRRYFENFAKTRNMDPLVAETWYSLSTELLQQKEAKYIFKLFKGYVKALKHVFPEVSFVETKFPSLPHRYWMDMNLRREFFCKFAKFKGFDPLVPENWYSLSIHSLLVFKSARSILCFYNGNFSKALIHLFPEIGLDRARLANVGDKFWYSKAYRKQLTELASKNDSDLMLVPNPAENLQVSEDVIPSIAQGVSLQKREYWASYMNRRKLLIEYARSNNFDPLVPENWYNLPSENVLTYVDGDTVLDFYDGNIVRALLHLFPEIGLQKSKFHDLPRKMLSDRSVQKEFFCDFATESGFDPLVPSNWYSQQILEHFSKRMGVKSILTQYGGSMGKALHTLFPEVNWDYKKLCKIPDKFWQHVSNQRDFFVTFAKEKGFDPLSPESWYSVKFTDIYQRKAARSILVYYKGSIISSLFHIFPDIGLDKTKFRANVPRNYWKDESNRRNFFEQYAKEHKFDPLVAKNWYSITVDDVLATKKGISVMSNYKNRLWIALLQLFPNIGLDSKKLLKGMTGQVKRNL